MNKEKFYRAEQALKEIDQNWDLDDFGEMEGSFFLRLPRQKGESRKEYGRRKGSIVVRSKKALIEDGGEPLYHEWFGPSLQICSIVREN